MATIEMEYQMEDLCEAIADIEERRTRRSAVVEAFKMRLEVLNRRPMDQDTQFPWPVNRDKATGKTFERIEAEKHADEMRELLMTNSANAVGKMFGIHAKTVHRILRATGNVGHRPSKEKESLPRSVRAMTAITKSIQSILEEAKRIPIYALAADYRVSVHWLRATLLEHGMDPKSEVADLRDPVKRRAIRGL